MKLVTDNAFSKAWKINCTTCKTKQPNSILWFKKQCHECEMKYIADKKYTEKDIQNVLDGFTNEASGQYIKTNFIELLNKQE